MRHVPNALTLSRIMFAGLVVIFMINQQFELALTSLAVGLMTDWVDGWVAKKWPISQSKLGADILEPICDMVLATAAVTMLIVVGFWPFWVGSALLGIAAVLQAISWAAGHYSGSTVLRRLKRHQNYIHPFFAVIVMMVALLAYIILTVPSSMLLPALLLFAVVNAVALLAKRDRIASMMRSPY